ncbi:MAG: hypothetical protein IT186_10780 [Acidobacteria bacterium]|nr:hypothetical protein [Acidobacteriota bacterium]
MTTIKLSDGAGINVDVTLSKSNAIARYGEGLPALVVDVAGIAAAWGSSVSDPGLSRAAVEASFKHPIALGDDAKLTLGGNLGLQFQLYEPGKAPKDLPEELGLDCPDDSVWARLTLEAGVSPAVESKDNDLSMGFTAGSVISISNFRRISASAAISVGSCFQELVRGFVIAGDLRDLEALPDDGTAAICVAGSASVSFTAKYPIVSSVNTLASTELPLQIGTFGVQAGASVEVSGSFSAEGTLTLAATRAAGSVTLVFLRNDQTEGALKVSASAGVKASIGETEVLSKLAELISSDPKTDAAKLAKAGLSKETIQQIKKAVETAIDRSLALAIGLALNTGTGHKRLFAFRLDLVRLTAPEKDAVHTALDGDVSSLLGLSGGAVTLVHSALGKLHSTGISLRFNLLGLLNAFSVTRLIIEGSVLVEPESGEVIICDKVTASRISGTLLPYAAEAHTVRKLLNSSFVMSATLMALHERLQPGLKLEAALNYFELHSRTCRQTMKDNLDAVEALDLITRPKAHQLLGNSLDEFGRSLMLLNLALDPQQCRELFLDSTGRPLPDTYYESAGCKALQLLVQPGDPDDFRLQLVAHWKQARSLGNPNSIAQAAWGSWFPKTPDGLRQARLIAADYQLIAWWATAMADAAESLVAFLSFLDKHPGISWQDNSFKKALATFSKSLAAAAKLSKPDLFANPWGFVATYCALPSTHGVRRTAQIFSKRLTLDVS